MAVNNKYYGIFSPYTIIYSPVLTNKNPGLQPLKALYVHGKALKK
jgi:hypothetical protein